MRLSTAFASGLSMGIFAVTSTTADAFVVRPPSAKWNFQRKSVLRQMINQGWDNENFLESLSKGQDAIERANQEYRTQSKYKPAASGGGEDDGPSDALLRKMGVPGSPPPPPEAPPADDEPSGDQGGSRYRQMLELSRQQNQTPPPVPPPSQPYPPQQGPYAQQPQQYQQPQFQDPYAQQQQQQLQQQPPTQYPSQDPYAQTPPPYDPYAQQQQQPQQPFAPPPPPQQQTPYPQDPYDQPPPPVKQRERVKGRNPDTEQIANTSDVYFAQLKRDSTLRARARMAGDAETANKPFADESVRKMKDMYVTSPYLENERKKASQMSDLLTTSPDELITKEMLETKKEKDKTDSGISYREKLKAQKEKKNKTPTTTTNQQPATGRMEAPPSVDTAKTTEVAPSASASSVAPSPEEAVANKPTEPVKEKGVESTTVSKPLAADVEASGMVTEKWPQVSAGGAAAATTPSAVAPQSEEDTRRKIRTLMGLILKHRGGPGFGAGRLKQPEAHRLVETIHDVTAVLRSEIGMGAERTEAPPPAAAASAAVKETPRERAASPVEEQSTVSTTPAVSATTTTATTTPVATDASGVPVPLVGAIACIEAAVKMYKESPPEAKEALLPALRSALLSAVNTCDKYIENGEMASFSATAAAVVAPPSPPPVQQQTAAFAQTEEALKSTSEPSSIGEILSGSVPSLASSQSGDDVNTQALRGIYETLKESAGDEKFGLKNLDATEARNVADSIVEMRSILMEELDSGIPPASESAASSTGSQKQAVTSNSPASSGAGPSKYQQMLAKAKAEKAGKKG